ncbi:MAG: glycosyltransferase family 4 protein [Motilibacteraceae bacterium]
MRNYLLTMLVAAAVTYLAVPAVRLVALKLGVMTEVRDRDVHVVPTPRLGGVAMLLGVGAGMLVASRLPLLRSVFSGPGSWWSQDWFALLTGAVLICLLGAIDDKWGIDAVTKLAGQVLAAGAMALQGVQLLWLPVGGTTLIPPPSVGVLLTVLVVLVSINAVNFVDGLDGLAAGIVAISAGSLFLFSYILSVEEGIDRADTPTMVAALTVGACLGFLPHNWYPARIFMGDSGSMLLGLLLAASTISLTGKVDPSAVTSVNLVPTLMPLVLPVLVLLVPLADLLLAVVRRTRAGRSPFAPDRQHLHHRLLEIGHSQQRAVLIMYAWTALVAVGILVVTLLGGLWPKLVLTAVAVLALLATLGVDQRRSARAAR